VLVFRIKLGFVGKLTGNIESVLLKKCGIFINKSGHF